MERSPARLFFALWPDEPLRLALASWLQPLIPPDTGRRVPAQNLHVTLAFLGNVVPERMPALEALADSLKWPAVVLGFDRLAYWPEARLVCLEAVAPPEAFTARVEQLREGLRAAGFEIERRPFRTHITLARNVLQPPKDIEFPRSHSGFLWPVRGMALVISTPIPGGSEYRVLREWQTGSG